jgi:hypothetical protein
MIKIFPPSDSLALLFDNYRQIEASSNHKFSNNYNNENFSLVEQTALTFFKKSENSEPSIFSTIYRRDWWPVGVYRVLNRTWQHPRVTKTEKNINNGLYEMLISQIEWCKTLPDFRTAIISRQVNHRLFLKMIKDLKIKNYHFNIGPKIWVCKGNEYDCLQDTMFYGDQLAFQEWWCPNEC